jgi:nucleoside-diphosphate-sugar epimerase
MKILVTGASGFVGTALGVHLTQRGNEVGRVVRTPHGTPQEIVIHHLDSVTDWRTALLGCDAIVHLAARVHVMHDSATDPVAVFREVNTLGTLNLATQAAAAGVKRLVYLSSIKVNGEGSAIPYRETDSPSPDDAYAISKWEAEQGLLAIAARTGLEVVILRPPLVYGSGVRANFRSLMNAVDRGWPLPLGMIRNRRSLVFLGNLIDAIRVCIDHPAAANKTYLVSDGEDVSTPELVRRLAAAMNRPARLLPVPPALLTLAGRLTGRHQAVSRLLGSLAIDSTAIQRDLGWRPPFSMAAGLQATVANDYIRLKPAR